MYRVPPSGEIQYLPGRRTPKTMWRHGRHVLKSRGATFVITQLQFPPCFSALHCLVGSSPTRKVLRTTVLQIPLTGINPLTAQTSNEKVFPEDAAVLPGAGVLTGLGVGVGVA